MQIRPRSPDGLITQRQDGAPATDQPVERPRILLAEDDPAKRYTIARLLRQDAFDVLEVSTGKETLAQAGQGIDILVLDVKLPDIDGFELARRLKSAPATASVPILLASATFVRDEERAKGLESGADAYLVYPIERAVLIAQVHALLRVRRAEQAQARALEHERLAIAQVAAERTSLHDLLMRAPALIAWLKGPDHLFELANDRFRALAPGGRQLIGRSAREALPEPWLQALLEPLNGTYQSGQARSLREVSIELPAEAGDGASGKRSFDLVYQPTHDADGGVDGILLHAFDVTATVRSRERAEALARELQNSEERFRGLVEATSQVVWTTDAVGSIVDLQPSWSAFTGQTPEGYRGFGWLDAIHPDDREQVRASWAEGHPQGLRYQTEYRLRRADGSYAWTSAFGAPVRRPDGTIREWIGMNIDITERRRAEQAVQLLADVGAVTSNPLDPRAVLAELANMVAARFADWCFIDLDEDGTMRRVAVGRAGSYPPGLGEGDLWRINASKSGPREHPPSQALRTGEPALRIFTTEADLASYAFDGAHLAALHAMRPRAVLSAPLLSRGRALGVITLVSAESGQSYGPRELELARELGRRAGLAIDNAQLFTAAERERERVEQANRAKDEFLAMVSHELRTPLTAMLGYTSMLRAGTLSEEKRARAVEIIDRNARSQAQLIEDLLDVSRIITGKLRLDVRPLNPMQVIEAALESVRPAAEARGVRLQTVLDPLAGPVSGDADRLQQVVWNLLSNAIKFTPRDGRVMVELARVHSSVELTVSDTGKGIPAEFLPHVFDRFRQADSSSTRSYGGLGLGLAIVKHLVELHGGTAEAYSAGEGQGASFTVRLPLAPLRSERELSLRAPPSVSPSAFTCPPELVDQRILVVDDEADTRELLHALLEGCGAQVATAGSVAEALEALDRSTFDAAISDLGMPGQDGYALIRELRQRPAERGGVIPVIALTAYARIEDRTRALLAGFTNHVAKPVEPSELLAVLASLLRDRRR